MYRCLSWIAVSSRPQTERGSPEEQAAQNAEIVRQIGGVIVGTLEVPGQSREYVKFDDAARDIEAYARLQAVCDTRGADVLICRDLSRLGRTNALIAQVVSMCHKAGIAIYSIAAPPVSLDPREQAENQGALIMLALEGALSETEMIRLRQRHRFGMRARIERGEMPGPIPYGYTRTGGKDTPVVPVPRQADIVRAIFDYYVTQGRSSVWVAQELNATRPGSTPRGLPWTHASVMQIINRAWVYAGFAELNRRSKTGRAYVRAPGHWPAIIDEDTAQAAQDERARRSTARRASNSPALLSQVMLCAVCGRYLSSRTQRPKKSARSPGYDRTYSCPVCHYVMGEAKVIYALRQVIAQITDQTIEEFAEGADLEGQRLAARLQDIERELDQIAARRKRLTGAYLDGLIEDADYRTMIEDQKTAADRLQADRGAIADRIAARDVDARRGRLEEIRAQGEAAVTGALGDTPACNAWIRTHFLIMTRDSEVEAVIYR